MGKERVSSLRSMGLGIRSEQDTDAEAADIRRFLPLDPQKPQKPGSTKPHQMWPRGADRKLSASWVFRGEELWARSFVLHLAGCASMSKLAGFWAGFDCN